MKLDTYGVSGSPLLVVHCNEPFNSIINVILSSFDALFPFMFYQRLMPFPPQCFFRSFRVRFLFVSHSYEILFGWLSQARAICQWACVVVHAWAAWCPVPPRLMKSSLVTRRSTSTTSNLHVCSPLRYLLLLYTVFVFLGSAFSFSLSSSSSAFISSCL